MADTENTPTQSRGLSDQQAVDMMLRPEEPREAPQGQAEPDPSEDPTGDQDQQAIGQRQSPPVDESEEQVEGLLAEEEGDEPDQEQEATDEDDPDAEAVDPEHSEESAEEAEAPREISPSDVIFHDPEGNPVTAEEAHRGYLRQADYTRKTQELSDARDKFMQEVQGRQQEREVLAETLSMALNVVEPRVKEFEGVDWDRLSREDPERFARLRMQREVAEENLGKLRSAARETVEAAKRDQLEQRQKQLALHHRAAQKLIPEMADPKKAPQFAARIKGYMQKGLGFSPEEASQITDARNLLAYHKALQFDMLQAKNRQVKSKKVSRAPKAGIKPGSPKTQAQRQEQARAAQQAKLRRTGKMEDAIDLLITKR